MRKRVQNGRIAECSKGADGQRHTPGDASTDTVPDAFRVLTQYEQAGHAIDLQVLNILMNGCAKLGDLITAMRLWDAYFAPYVGGGISEATGAQRGVTV